MAGNVAEWTSTVFTEAGVEAMNDINPHLKYNAAKETYIKSAWRSSEYQNQPRSYIGFRCVRSLANTTSQKSPKSKKK